MSELQNLLINSWMFLKDFLSPFLRDLDPSLFQNIILGILAIFIPFAIVFLTDLLDSKKQRNEFEKMVLSEEVLGTKKVFWLSVIGIVVLAFFSGKDISIARKLFAIIFSLILIFLFWNPFRRILRFSEGYKPEFELSFLKSLRFPKIFHFGNKLRMERMVRSWTSLWSEKSTYNERDFTKEFISHIDEAIAYKKYSLAIVLGQAYQKNIDKRDRFSIDYEVLPKLFEWNKLFWEAQQRWLYRENRADKLQKSPLLRPFPKLKKWVYKLVNKFYTRNESTTEYFWNWHYFQQELFPAVAKTLLFDGHGPYQLFTSFKRYVDEAEEELEKITDENKKQHWWNHITGLFGAFCPMFFENIDSAPNSHGIWEHDFPQEWKITSTNSKNRPSRIVLHEFLQWAQHRIFKESEDNYDKDLTEVVNGLFPSVHNVLFPTFLILLFSGELKYAVQKEQNFFLMNTSFSWSGEKSDKEIQHMLQQQDQSQQAETINIILEYFGHWRLLKVYKDDLTEEEFSMWEGYSEEQRKNIVTEVRKKKLQNILNELRSPELIELCKKSERWEDQRKDFITLIELLAEKIS